MQARAAGWLAGTHARAHAPSGMLFRMPSSYFLSIDAVMSDAMNPGATALHVMVRLANSRAVVFVRPITPALAAL